MKITVKEFQSQPFEVKASNRNIKKAIKLQLAASKIDDTQDKSMAEVSENTLAFFDEEKAFLCDVLKLNAKQADMFDDLDFKETGDVLGNVISKLLNNSQEAKVSEEPKK